MLKPSIPIAADELSVHRISLMSSERLTREQKAQRINAWLASDEAESLCLHAIDFEYSSFGYVSDVVLLCGTGSGVSMKSTPLAAEFKVEILENKQNTADVLNAWCSTQANREKRVHLILFAKKEHVVNEIYVFYSDFECLIHC